MALLAHKRKKSVSVSDEFFKIRQRLVSIDARSAVYRASNESESSLIKRSGQASTPCHGFCLQYDARTGTHKGPFQLAHSGFSVLSAEARDPYRRTVY